MEPIIKIKPCPSDRVAARVEEGAKYDAELPTKVFPWSFKTREEYDKAEAAGLGVFEKPIYDFDAENIEIPSSYGDHKISIRLIRPKKVNPRAVFMYMHGGGFVVGAYDLQDKQLMQFAERTGLIFVSVEYRKAPPHKVPACTDDCEDAARWLLSEEGVIKLGAPLKFIGGESVGGYFTVQVSVRLRDSGIDVKRKLAGLAPTYGLYDLTQLPGLRHERNSEHVPAEIDVLAVAIPEDIFHSLHTLKRPEWSPLYNRFHNLPPASFSVGTHDGLFDDTVLIAVRWQLDGSECELKVYPGATHGYLTMSEHDVTSEAWDDFTAFTEARLKAHGL